jgi:hypothetical protein
METTIGDKSQNGRDMQVDNWNGQTLFRQFLNLGHRVPPADGAGARRRRGMKAGISCM